MQFYAAGHQVHSIDHEENLPPKEIDQNMLRSDMCFSIVAAWIYVAQDFRARCFSCKNHDHMAEQTRFGERKEAIEAVRESETNS